MKRRTNARFAPSQSGESASCVIALPPLPPLKYGRAQCSASRSIRSQYPPNQRSYGMRVRRWCQNSRGSLADLRLARDQRLVAVDQHNLALLSLCKRLDGQEEIEGSPSVLRSASRKALGIGSMSRYLARAPELRLARRPAGVRQAVGSLAVARQKRNWLHGVHAFAPGRIERTETHDSSGACAHSSASWLSTSCAWATSSANSTVHTPARMRFARRSSTSA